MTKFVSIFGLILQLALVGCGTESPGQPETSRGQVQTSNCGAHGGFQFRLHKVDCETANSLIVMLDGRALHQSVIVTVDGKRRGAWVCTSPTHSLLDPLHCRQGSRFFTLTRGREGES